MRQARKLGRKERESHIEKDAKGLTPLLQEQILPQQLERKKLARIEAKTEVKIRTFPRLLTGTATKRATILLTVPSLPSQKTSCSLGYLHVDDCYSGGFTACSLYSIPGPVPGQSG